MQADPAEARRGKARLPGPLGAPNGWIEAPDKGTNPAGDGRSAIGARMGGASAKVEHGAEKDLEGM